MPLPIVVAAFTIAVALVVGEWLVATVYLYAQWFHYTRQSYGISRMYLRKAGAIPATRDLVLDGVIYGLPLWGILSRSHQRPATFLALPILHRSGSVAMVYAVGAVASVERAVVGRARECGSSAAAVPTRLTAHTSPATSRSSPRAICLIATSIPGWLVLNIWHNLQYILIVWMFNVNRFQNGGRWRTPIPFHDQPAAQRASSTRSSAGRIGTALYFNIDRRARAVLPQRAAAVAAGVHDHQLPPLRCRRDHLAPSGRRSGRARLGAPRRPSVAPGGVLSRCWRA